LNGSFFILYFPCVMVYTFNHIQKGSVYVQIVRNVFAGPA